MAAAATGGGKSGIFWMNDVSDEEQPLVFVPGVNGGVSFSSGPGRTSKKGGRMKARDCSGCKTEPILKKGVKKKSCLQSDRYGSYAKEKVPAHASHAVATEHTLSSASSTVLPLSLATTENRRDQSQVCLKDLCPEDKRRIANLIEELARVSEEKEESVQRLKDEQGNFERKIQHLEQQNLIIAQERESLQQQYRECQELLGLYQQYLTQQQVKLNQSIAQLSQAPAHSKVVSSEEVPGRSTNRANGTLLDGSYLSFATAGAQQPEAHRSSCPDSGYGTHQQRRNNGYTLENGPQDTLNQQECERLQSGNRLKTKEALTSPLLGREDWEEKRHQLLLQKMQLEMERERLQARLAEQEERLNRQNQQLFQSRLDYRRLQEAAQSELSCSNTKNGDPEPEGPSHQDLPPSVHEDVVVPPAERSSPEEQTAPAPLESISHTVAFTQCKSHKTTPPEQPPTNLRKPTSAPVTQKTPKARLDFSVVELLDIFTPVSAPEQSNKSTGRPKTPQCGPAWGTLLTTAGHRPPTQQDLEESQILEDIFFIC
ncbi:protein hinderin [Aulostomus maculatus]